MGEERSIAMHRAIGERLRADPALVETARKRVQSWLETGSVGGAYANAWAALLAAPIDQLIDALVDPAEKARALRQVSPFAGVLDPRTRWRIRRDVARAVK